MNKFWRFILPSTITPRYTPTNSSSQEIINKNDLINVMNPETISSSSISAYNWTIKVEINSPSEIKFLKSSSHDINS